ncbi:MAG: hypothetical protein GY765_07080 [bacterium]|nr:hypothetical protein [bacterium]
MRKLVAVFFLSVLCFTLYGSTATRIQPGDLTYMGAFRLPTGYDVGSWQWGGYAMTYYPSGDPAGASDGFPGSIFGCGHEWEYQVSEISIPVPVISATKSLGDLNTATTLQGFRNIFSVGNLEMPRIGMCYLPAQGSQTSDKLYFCRGQHMQDEGQTFYTHGWFDLTLTNPQRQGMWDLACAYNVNNTNDYMFEIPSAWASTHASGRILATGRFRDGGWSGMGPAIFAISPWTQGNPPPAGTSLNYTELLRYTSSYNYDEEHTMTNYHHSDAWPGGAWLTAGDKSAVIFVGTKGTGECWYGDQNGACTDCAGERGWWSTAFEGQIIFYDPDDLAQVTAGTMERWDPQPYASLNVDQYLYHISSTQQWYHLSGVCFDRTNGLLYVFEPFADDDKPLVHVWKLEAGTVTPTLTVTAPNGGESLTIGTSSTISWTSAGTVGNVQIRYSTDNGTSWSEVVAGTANDGSYSWTVPNAASSQCLVNVRETDGSPTDTSNAVFTISESAGSAVIALSRTGLNFGGIRGGTSPASQSFEVSNSAGGTMSWSISENAPWLSCTPVSGSSTAEITVSVDISGLSAGQYDGTISCTASGASNSPQTLAVALEIHASNTAPFGQYATPADGSGQSGSVAFTGWVLDDTGVASLKLYRQDGTAMVYIGDAVFVEGARQDVEAAYPDYPMNYRAGWGYMMLTNFLPNSGNGTFTIYAVATDTEGVQATLGAKTITVNNADAVKPFGAIDTPAQGGSASGGAFRNEAWVLTPPPNTIPTDGSTLNVWVDGVNLGNPQYNLYRPDIAGFFPGYANTNGARGYFDIDTTTYDNGVHSIYWTATDNAGNSDGIGSRYFSVANTGGSAKKPRKTIINTGTFKQALAGQIPFAEKGVLVRKGYQLTTEPKPVGPGKDGVIHVVSKELQRVEIAFNTTGLTLEDGCGILGNSIQSLPVGSTMDKETGIFYWQPGPGFIGTYRFMFLLKTPEGEQIQSQITITLAPCN